MESTVKHHNKAAMTTPINPEGFCQWKQIRHHVSFCRSTFLKMVKDGRAPKGQRLSLRATVYPNAEIILFLANPSGYRATGVQK